MLETSFCLTLGGCSDLPDPRHVVFTMMTELSRGGDGVEIPQNKFLVRWLLVKTGVHSKTDMFKYKISRIVRLFLWHLFSSTVLFCLIEYQLHW